MASRDVATSTDAGTSDDNRLILITAASAESGSSTVGKLVRQYPPPPTSAQNGYPYCAESVSLSSCPVIQIGVGDVASSATRSLTRRARTARSPAARGSSTSPVRT